MERNFFVQGTGNRILYTIFEPPKPPNLSAEEFFVTGEKERQREGEISKLAQALGRVYKSNLRWIWPMPEAGEVWMDYKKGKDREAYKRYKANPQDVEYTYLQRLPVAALKVAGLAAVSRSYLSLPKLKGDTLMIGLEDMNWAIMKIENHLKHFRNLLEKWEITPREIAPEVHERELLRMLAFVRDSEDGMLLQSELLSRSEMVKDKRFYNLIATLVSRKELEVVSEEEVKAFSREVCIRHGLLVKEGGGWRKSYRGQIPNVYRYVRRP